MRCDSHTHTHFSDDSDARLHEYCEHALEIGVKCITFTDHIDFNPHDNGYGYYNHEKFFAEFEAVKKRYGDRLILLSGLEFGEPHEYKKEFEQYSAYPYDFMLGTIHFWMDDLFASEVVASGIPCEDAFDVYYMQMKNAIEYGGFDSMAHFDFPKRYYNKLVFDRDTVLDIFELMVKKNILLEINTSGLRKSIGKSLPDDELLELYALAGGKYYTFGSDAHTPLDLYKGFDYAEEKAKKFGLSQVVFIGRNAVRVSEL